MRHAYHLKSTLHAEGGEGELFDIFFRINADTFQCRFKLLELVRKNASLQGLPALGVFHPAVVHIDDLLNVGWNHSPGSAGERGPKAKNGDETKSGKSRDAVLHRFLNSKLNRFDEQLWAGVSSAARTRVSRINPNWRRELPGICTR